jgi:NAD(P)-dependent dehydrogenase (short-subunit alcohol dehydrogenase family)
MALVTGSSRGLGRAIAVALARAGADVAVGLRDVSRDEGVIDEIRGVGRRVIAVQMDVTNAQQVKDAVQMVVQELGALDVLVNNAGGGAGLTRAEAISPSDFQRTIDVNLTGTFATCQAAFSGRSASRSRSGCPHRPRASRRWNARRAARKVRACLPAARPQCPS